MAVSGVVRIEEGTEPAHGAGCRKQASRVMPYEKMSMNEGLSHESRRALGPRSMRVSMEVYLHAYEG